MGNKKRIDRLFQEHFKDFEVTPDPALWQTIEAQLHNKKKKRRIIPIWWHYTGTAAAIAILLSAGILFFFNNTTLEATPPKVVLDIDDSKTKNHTTTITNSSLPDNTTPPITTHKNNTTPKKVKSITLNTAAKNVVAHTDNLPHTNTLNTTKTTATLANKTRGNSIAIATPAKTTTSVKHTLINSKALNATNNTTALEHTLTNSDTLQPTQKHTITPTTIAEVLEKTTTNKALVKAKEQPVSTKPSIEDAIAANEELNAPHTAKSTTDKWSIAPNVAPVYFNSLSQNGSALNEQFDNNSKSGEVNVSYGINASYAISKKVTIRSGINKVNLGFNTNNVVALRSIPRDVALNDLESIPNLPPPTNAITTTNNDVALFSAESVSANLIETTNTTSINQSFNFIEVPLEIQYALSTKRLGINLIGGFSSFFLNSTNATSEINGLRTDIDATDNINKTSYSANLGLGLNYKISKKINFNLEPLFKYQINTFQNTTGNFQPYFIGVYTGFGIKL
jgi:hypothetical protein